MLVANIHAENKNECPCAGQKVMSYDFDNSPISDHENLEVDVSPCQMMTSKRIEECVHMPWMPWPFFQLRDITLEI